ncbi:hypothetical protein pb186bvf_002453 [Paramecium bursaria]
MNYRKGIHLQILIKYQKYHNTDQDQKSNKEFPSDESAKAITVLIKTGSNFTKPKKYVKLQQVLKKMISQISLEQEESQRSKNQEANHLFQKSLKQQAQTSFELKYQADSLYFWKNR